ncbi:MAG: Hsp20/alpha crystallin family protein [Candidatus Taylorbacteria bacterium]|nr:Hsp20/alpha crystallin family protein [Candidatus Taylorbacteria bacterium]
MPKEKKSFFERLTGSVKLEENEFETRPSSKSPILSEEVEKDAWENTEQEKEGELTVDVYQTAEHIVIKTMVAGVRPEDLDISITRDLVTIRGKREEDRSVKTNDYFVQELYWGAFSRSITLPEEVDVEESEAIEKHGLLIIKMPKLDKGRQTKLKVKTI